MSQAEIIAYSNRRQMEETTAKVFARLNYMKSIVCRTLKKTSCGSKSNLDGTYCSPQSFYEQKLTDYETASFIDNDSDDTISTISGDSMDSGVSTLSDFSHNSSSSSTLLLNRTSTRPNLCHLRCDPSIINYVSHNLLATNYSELHLDEIDDQMMNDTSSMQVPLAESSRRMTSEGDEHDRTLIPDGIDDDEHAGPLTSTFIDRWHTIMKPYAATFRQDLSVRKNELVQVLRAAHPHWIWVRNEVSEEGFVPTDCLLSSS